MTDELMNPARERQDGILRQTAEKIINIDHAETVQTRSTIVFAAGLPGGPKSTQTETAFSRDYYNLIVYGDTPFTQEGHLTMSQDRCLNTYTSPELKARFTPLTPQTIEELKTFPCIVASENKRFGKTEEDHYALIAQLTDIRRRSNGTELYFRPFFLVSQQRLNDLEYELAIRPENRSGFPELNHSHWTVKEIDLLEVLHDAGLIPFG